MRDLYSNAKVWNLLLSDRDTEGTETVTGTAVDTTGYNGRATAYLTVSLDASATSADNVAVKLQECSAADGTGAADISGASFTTVAGSGAAKTASEQIAVNLNGLSSSKPYIRASATITDENSSGSYVISCILVADQNRYNPVN